MQKTSKEESEEIRQKILAIKEHFGMTRKMMCKLLGNMNLNRYKSNCRENQTKNNFKKTDFLVLKANLKKLQSDYKLLKH